MIEMLHKEFVYLWYYFDIQLRQIFPYWILGMVLGSAISVFVVVFPTCRAPQTITMGKSKIGQL